MSFLDPGVWSGKIYSGGWVDGGAGVADVTEPATGDVLEKIGIATAADVATAAVRAREAQREWAARSYDERAKVLRQAGDLWLRFTDPVSDWIVREAGSIPPKAQFEIGFASTTCYEAAGLASVPYGELLRSAQARMSLSRRLPVGVVGVISPFNFPLILSIRAVAPALALGNAVVLKPDPRTAVCGGFTLASIFEEAGLPEGLLSILPGGVDVGQALIADPGTDMVSFTGSTNAGRSVGELAARHMKRAHLELGGNSALVILDDADIESAATVGSFGSFFHSGQICMATSRHLVDASIADDYVAALTEHAEHLPVGNPATEQVAVGPIIDAKQRDNIHEIVTGSVAVGARLATGGTFENLFYKPTVLTDVPINAPAFMREIFGPVAPVTQFNSLDEAARLAGSTSFGLSLGIMTKDVMKGLALADRIPSGIVHINDSTVNDEGVNPFGGVGDSGPGSRLGGVDANLEAFTTVQWVTMRAEPPGYPF